MWSPVGSPYSIVGNTGTVAPTVIGDVLIAEFGWETDSPTGAPIGGGVTKWFLLEDNFWSNLGSQYHSSLYWGIITSTGVKPIAFSSNNASEMIVQQFHNSSVGTVVQDINTGGTGSGGGGGFYVATNYPPITPSVVGDHLYIAGGGLLRHYPVVPSPGYTYLNGTNFQLVYRASVNPPAIDSPIWAGAMDIGSCNEGYLTMVGSSGGSEQQVAIV
jgi:hypothetical protein